MADTEFAGQLELFAAGPQPLGSVPLGLGCFECSYCRRPIKADGYYWEFKGRQYRTHDACYGAAAQTPDFQKFEADYFRGTTA